MLKSLFSLPIEPMMTRADWEKRVLALQEAARKERQRLFTLDPGFGPDRESLLKLLSLNKAIIQAWENANDF